MRPRRNCGHLNDKATWDKLFSKKEQRKMRKLGKEMLASAKKMVKLANELKEVSNG
jgi:hypothetical protein